MLHGKVAIKRWAEGAFGEPVRIASWFYLKIFHNTNLLLGTLPLDAVSVAYWLFVCVALVWVWWRMATTQRLPVGIGYALLGAGFTSNALDRARGEVVDYLAFGPIVGDKWLFANLADVVVLSGITLLTLALIRSRVRRRKSLLDSPG